MKNKMMNVGVVAFGLSVALVLSPSNADASDDSVMVDVNVLSKEDGESTVLDVEVLDAPIVDDVNVNIPSDPETEDTKAVATVDVSDGVVDDVDISILEKTDSKASVGTVELESSLTDNVVVDVVAGEKTTTTFDGGVVEANAEDLPLLGETHVGVLDKHVTGEEEGQSFTSGLIQTEVDEGLLDDVSVDVLVAGKEEDVSVKAAISADVDVSVDDDEGLLDDLGVSVLKHEESEMKSKAALASVELETSATDDLNVDVVSSDRTENSFDGGLVEVNGEDVPLLGDTHVGVLDRHVESDEDGSSYSSGLIQMDMYDGLLEDTSAGVLVRKMEVNEDGKWMSDTGASLDLGMPETDGVSADVLKRQLQFQVAVTNPPNVDAYPATGGNDDGVEESAMDAVDERNVTVVPESTDEGTADGNEVDQGTVTPPANESEAVDEPKQESTATEGLTGAVDADFGFQTGVLNGGVDASALLGKEKSSIMNGFAMNDGKSGSSLPKTGGFWDGKRMAFLALLLVVTGFAFRRLGKSSKVVA